MNYRPAENSGIWGKLWPSEKLSILSVSFFSVLIIIDYFLHQNKAIYLLPFSLLVIILQLLIPSWQGRFSSRPLTLFGRLAFSLAVYAYLYKLAGSLVHLLNYSWFDAHLLKLDRLIFGFSPNLAVVSHYQPWLTELMMFSYFFYLPLVVILAYQLFRKFGPEETEGYVLTLGLAYILCFIIFILWPAASPRFYLSNQPASGFLFWNLMKVVEAHGQYQGGSFPSAHCAAGLVMIIYAWRAGKKTFLIVFPLIILFFLSTVYGQYHYGIDVLAGIIIGFMAFLLSQFIFSHWSERGSI